jgi:hypothetical protein
MTSDQEAVDSFFRSTVSNLEGSVLAGGQQNGNVFSYQYIKETTPVTVTVVSANKINSNSSQFQLSSIIQSINGSVNGRDSAISIVQSVVVGNIQTRIKNVN